VVEETVRGKGDGYNWYKGALQRYGKFPDAVAAWRELKRYAYGGHTKGYLRIRVRPGRRFKSGNEVLLHRLVKAYELGRMLKLTEVVHHVDGDPTNNHPGNLKLVASHFEHLEEHGWFGGTKVYKNGVVYAWDPERRKARPLGRMVIERFLGRALKKGEVAVRLNGDPRDNRPSNLRVMTRGGLSRMNGRKYGNGRKKTIEKCAA
jgi:hypothetical protein